MTLPDGRRSLIRLRRDTSADWAAVDPILAAGEPGWDDDTGELKVGDGVTVWSALPPTNADTYAAQVSVPTLEELWNSTSLDTVTVAVTLPIFVAKVPCRVASVSLVSMSAIAASDTDYYTVVIDRKRYGGTAAAVATKTTRVTGGEGVTAAKDWNLDSVLFDANNRIMKAGDVLTAAFYLTGTPAAWTTPLAAVRYEPYTLPAGPEIHDTFDRADSATSPGTTDSGHLWVETAGAWGIASNQLYLPSATSNDVLLLDSYEPDVTVQATMVANGGSTGLIIRGIDAANYISHTSAVGVKRIASTTSNITGSTFITPLAAGDVSKIVAVGDTLYFYRNGVLNTTAPVVETTHQTATKVGFRSSTNTAQATRWDDFSVET